MSRRIKRNLTIAALMTAFSTVTIGMASWVFTPENLAYEDQGLIAGNSLLTFDYNDGGLTPNHLVGFDKEVGVTVSAADLPKPSIDTSNHRFSGWYLDKAGQTPADFSKKFEESATLYAKYVNNDASLDYGTALPDNGTMYVTPETAYGYAAQRTVFISPYQEGTSPSSTLTITGNVDFQYYNDTDAKCYSFNASKVGTKLFEFQPLENADTIAILDSDVVIDGGTLSFAGVHGSKSNQGVTQLISGDFTALDLNGYTITVKNGGHLKGYGIIYNSKTTGGIYVENGSLTTVGVIADFKGGTNIAAAFQQNHIPFTNIMAPYLNCEAVFTEDSYLYGEASLNASSSKYSTTIPFLGKAFGTGDDAVKPLIRLEDGYMVRRATSYSEIQSRLWNGKIAPFGGLNIDDYDEDFIFTTDPRSDTNQIPDEKLPEKLSNVKAQVQLISLTISSIPMVGSASMDTFDFPVSSFWNISFHSADFRFGQSVAFLPGSTLYVDKDSSVLFENYLFYNLIRPSDIPDMRVYARVTFADYYPTYHKRLSNASLTEDAHYLPTRLLHNAYPAKAVIDGTLGFMTGNVDIDSVHEFYTLSGQMDLSDSALKSIRANKDVLKIRSTFYYPVFLQFGSGLSKVAHVSAGRYYSRPIISNGTAYYQKAGSQEILSSKTYDWNSNTLVDQDGQTNFFKYDEEKYLGLWTSASAVPPTVEILGRKINNEAGYFTPCTIKETSDGVPYLTYLDNGAERHFVYVDGAYIEVLEEPTAAFVSCPVDPDNNKFTIPPDAKSSAFCASRVVYNKYMERWLFTNV